MQHDPNQRRIKALLYQLKQPRLPGFFHISLMRFTIEHITFSYHIQQEITHGQDGT